MKSNIFFMIISSLFNEVIYSAIIIESFFFRQIRGIWRSVCGVFLAGLIFSLPVYASNNILLIIADDFGVDSHGLYGVGSDVAPTPTIDGLALQGVRFDRAWSNSICSPTRATILTGRYSFRTGVGDADKPKISQSEYSIAKALGTLGYSTALFGKWHLGDIADSKPNKLGFDHYASPPGGELRDYFSWSKDENGVVVNISNYATTENVDDAIEWINNQESLNPDEPWFIWLAFNAPHSPFHKPPNELHSYDSLSGTELDIEENPVPYYQAMVEAMDTEIARLLNTIDRANTNVIFVGDNGTPKPVTVSPADSSRVKGSLYQGGVWVPLIASGPVVTRINETNGSLVNSVDLFATMIEMAGGNVAELVPPEIVIDSLSLMPLLTQSTQAELCDYVFAERFGDPVRRPFGKTIRNDQYKLIRFDLGDERFYRMSNDFALYPVDEVENLLEGSLNSEEQANYDNLSSKLASLLSNEEVGRFCFLDAETATYQMEDGVLSGRTRFASTLAGFTGQGYIHYFPIGGAVEQIINAPVAGLYQLTFRYSLLNLQASGEIFVNEVLIEPNLVFPVVSQTIWGELSSTIELGAGDNVVLLSIADAKINVDSVVVTPALIRSSQ